MLAPGSQIGRYEVQRKLGRGGMGTVYVAHDPVLGRMVAIKVFMSDLDLPDASERFTREARSAAALSHANIVTVFDFGEYDSQPYIAMEYVPGETLADLIKRKASISLADKLRWMEELCAGAAYAHRLGVVHRDIKPMNLMVDRSSRLKILDFGIAKMLGSFASSATALVGTPGYMAPEQILGGFIDNRADIFSIGVVCYELLSYAQAFPGENTHAITHRILTQEPTPLLDLVPGLSPDLAACIERAMRKTSADRLADAEEFRGVLARARRTVENDNDDNEPTVLTPRPGTQPRRMTDASHHPDRAAVGAMTPPPTVPTRKDIDGRRVAQIEAALERSRAALHRGDLDVAEDECLQALTLNDQHPAALELEALIKVAIAKQRSMALLGEARKGMEAGALTSAQALVTQARELDPNAAELLEIETSLQQARASLEHRVVQRTDAVRSASEAAERALGRGDVQAALALARQALELDPTAERARAVEAQALRVFDEQTSDIPVSLLVGSAAASAAIPATVGTAATVVAPPKTVPAPKASVATSTKQPAKNTRLIMGAAAAAVVVVVAAVAVLLIPNGPAATYPVVIDASPFATVSAIKAPDGSTVTIPADNSTPLSIPLAAGIYEVDLVGPPPGNETRSIRVEVTADGVVVPATQFQALTPAEYFEQYLSLPALPAAIPDGSVAPADAPAARGTGQ
jgi:tetratricopeptide (TPR) repeat protein/predicted Ser/Thr protein kinase